MKADRAAAKKRCEYHRRKLFDGLDGKLAAAFLEVCAELEAEHEVHEDHKRLVRELDVIWNGEEGAAKQASLCDMVSQIADEWPKERTAREAAERALTEMEKAKDLHYARAEEEKHYANHHARQAEEMIKRAKAAELRLASIEADTVERCAKVCTTVKMPSTAGNPTSWIKGTESAAQAIRALRTAVPNGGQPIRRSDSQESPTGGHLAAAACYGHASDCAVNNAPAYPPGECDCDYSKGATAHVANKDTLSFSGNGKVSVSVSDILKSPKVQRQVASVREIAASQLNESAAAPQVETPPKV